jgi:lycopene cyclase domain-containing protein
MTYSGFLVVFLGAPILILAGAAWLDNRRRRQIPRSLTGWNPWAAIALHVVIAVVYTTPWDNYLVANGVWYYNPALVTGLVLGWVPIEEYVFFVLQTVLAGLWMLFLAKRLQFQQPPIALRPAWRWAPVAILGVLWVISVGILVTGRIHGTYLGLELTWALPPIILQLVFGGDILRRYAQLVLGSLIPLVIYLSIADSVAIISGTWTISPEQSLNVFIGSLPFEEILFFLLTSTLVIFGITLLLSLEGQQRLEKVRSWLGRRGKSSSEPQKV